MLRWRVFPKLGHQFIFWFIVVGALSILGLSAYHFLLFKAALKQQTLFGPGGSEFLLTSIDLLKTKMLLSMLVVLGLAVTVLYGITRKIVDPLGKLAAAMARGGENRGSDSTRGGGHPGRNWKSVTILSGDGALDEGNGRGCFQCGGREFRP